ncbi:hypothetical protein PHYBOEH_009731 [Phytophthora boehmeriae]|uniref:RxLR effector protein n=1 Tax=Phytophthora boehmeriae TaxID=109152 RepID=A0A8T1VWG6_9STRA|nr:hypothetical protein PHYBOEH_009731 [Phytophthora boehmeriae]
MSFEFGLSDDYVKQLFGMKGLTGEKLTSHKNYKHYEWVRHKKEGQMMGKWLDRWSDDLTPRPTFKVWEHFGLEAMALRNVPLSDIKKTPGFASYERYVKGFDYYVMRWRKSSYPRKIQIPREASRTEMLAKAEIWGKTQMTDDYVLYALGLNKMSRERLAVNDDYNHVFKRFKEVQAEAKMKV